MEAETAAGAAHQVCICLPDFVAVNVDVGRLHLGEALDWLPDHDSGAGQRCPLALHRERSNEVGRVDACCHMGCKQGVVNIETEVPRRFQY